MTSEQPTAGQPSRALLYTVYAVLFITLIAVLVIVGIYGT